MEGRNTQDDIGLRSSLARALGQSDVPRFTLNLRDSQELPIELTDARLELAIVVIYLPNAERISHYFFTRLLDQFDAVLHSDETRAVEPLELTPWWERGEVPETCPFGV